jgi:hypothetical protein
MYFYILAKFISKLHLRLNRQCLSAEIFCICKALVEGCCSILPVSICRCKERYPLLDWMIRTFRVRHSFLDRAQRASCRNSRCSHYDPYGHVRNRHSPKERCRHPDERDNRMTHLLPPIPGGFRNRRKSTETPSSLWKPTT